jgi:AmiR/NasT family two-component response regulator
VIAREIEVEDVGAVTTRERPDVALVGLGESSEHALQLVEKIVHKATCPVIALIHAPDPDFVKEASKRGVFAYITDAEVKDWQSSIDIVLRRFTEYHDLESAFGRRAVTERAKGILMERHSVDEPAAFEMLREHARSTNRKLVDVASAVVDGHGVLPKQPRSPARLTRRAAEEAKGRSFRRGVTCGWSRSLPPTYSAFRQERALVLSAWQRTLPLKAMLSKVRGWGLRVQMW